MPWKSYRQESKKNYGRDVEGGVHDADLTNGSLMRLADTADEFLRWARSFQGCRLVRSAERMSRGVKVRHEFTLRIEIKWPWLRKRQAKKRAARA